MTTNGYKISFAGSENVLELGNGDHPQGLASRQPGGRGQEERPLERGLRNH